MPRRPASRPAAAGARSRDVSGDPLRGPARYRPGGARLLAGAWWVVAVGLGVDLVVRGSLPAVLVGVPVLVLTCAIVFAMFWYPAVEVDDDAVELVNPIRHVRLPWARVEELDTRWALSIRAGGRSWTSWAAPASGRRVRPVSRREAPWVHREQEGIAGSSAPGSSAGEAALLVGTRWQAWQDSHERIGGDVPDAPGPGVQVRWNAPVAGLLVGSSAALAVALGVLALTG